MLLVSTPVFQTDPPADLCDLNAGSILVVLSTIAKTITFIQTPVFADVALQGMRSFLHVVVSFHFISNTLHGR
jgi:hypothetical protein